jgi:hypothetical protein
MKSRYTLVVRQILLVLIAVGLGGTVTFTGAAEVSLQKGTVKNAKPSVTSGKTVKAQGAQRVLLTKPRSRRSPIPCARWDLMSQAFQGQQTASTA